MREQIKRKTFYQDLRKATRHDLLVHQQKQRAATIEAIRSVFHELDDFDELVEQRRKSQQATTEPHSPALNLPSPAVNPRSPTIEEGAEIRTAQPIDERTAESPDEADDKVRPLPPLKDVREIEPFTGEGPDPVLEARVLTVDTPVPVDEVHAAALQLAQERVFGASEDSDMMDVSSEESRGPLEGGRRPDQQSEHTLLELPFTIYDALVDVPPSLLDGSSWLIKPRPDGTRCLLSCTHGDLIVQDRSRRTKFRLSASALTHLNRAAMLQVPQRTILDGIWTSVGENYLFFILDVIVWNGIDLHECEFGLRHFNMLSKFQELDYVGVFDDSLGVTDSVSLVFVATHTNTSDTLQRIQASIAEANAHEVRKLAAEKPFPMIFELDLTKPAELDLRIKFDGLLFIDRASPYTVGTNLQILHWRSPEVSIWAAAAEAQQGGQACLWWPCLSPHPITADGYVCIPEFAPDDTARRLRRAVAKAKDDLLVRLRFASILIADGRLTLRDARVQGWRKRTCTSWRWTSPDSAQKVTLYSSVAHDKTPNDPFLVRPPTLESLIDV